jgi:hypothetical protein
MEPRFPAGRKHKQLAICRACTQFVQPHEIDCPFCGENLAEAALTYQMRLAEARAAASELERLLAELGFDLSKVPGGPTR